MMGNILKILGLVADFFSLIKKLKFKKTKKKDEKEEAELEGIFDKHSDNE